MKLSKGTGASSNHGAVLMYKGDDWYRLCDTGFNDLSARTVCRELGYVEGRAIGSSAFGPTLDTVLMNYTMRCQGHENSAEECLKKEKCHNDNYASVVCFLSNTTISEGGFCSHFQYYSHSICIFSTWNWTYSFTHLILDVRLIIIL